MNESTSRIDGPLFDPATRHAITARVLHDTVRVHVETGYTERGVTVKRKAALPFRNNENDDYGNRRRTRDGREAIEVLWQRHFGKLEHFDRADRLPGRLWGVIVPKVSGDVECPASRGEAVCICNVLADPFGERTGLLTQYRLVGPDGDVTTSHDCAHHLTDLATGHREPDRGPQPFTVRSAPRRELPALRYAL